jgi:hypothetical protein
MGVATGECEEGLVSLLLNLGGRLCSLGNHFRPSCVREDQIEIAADGRASRIIHSDITRLPLFRLLLAVELGCHLHHLDGRETCHPLEPLESLLVEEVFDVLSEVAVSLMKDRIFVQHTSRRPRIACLVEALRDVGYILVIVINAVFFVRVAVVVLRHKPFRQTTLGLRKALDARLHAWSLNLVLLVSRRGHTIRLGCDAKRCKRRHHSRPTTDYRLGHRSIFTDGGGGEGIHLLFLLQTLFCK